MNPPVSASDEDNKAEDARRQARYERHFLEAKTLYDSGDAPAPPPKKRRRVQHRRPGPCAASAGGASSAAQLITHMESMAAYVGTLLPKKCPSRKPHDLFDCVSAACDNDHQLRAELLQYLEDGRPTDDAFFQRLSMAAFDRAEAKRGRALMMVAKVRGHVISACAFRLRMSHLRPMNYLIR